MQPESFVMPSAVESENVVLGRMITSGDSYYEAVEQLSAEDFYRPTNQDIFKALRKLTEGRESVDVPLLEAELKDTFSSPEFYEQCGGSSAEYLMNCIDAGTLAGKLKPHIDRVKRASLRRKVISESYSLIGTVMNDEEADPAELLTESALKYQSDSGRKGRTFEELTGLVWSQVSAYHDGKPKRGIPFGIDRLDFLTYGVGPGEFVVIGGRPSEGKTILLTQLAISAGKQGVPVLFFSAEMSGEEIGERALIAEARIDGGKARGGQFSDEDWSRAGNAANTLYQLPITVEDVEVSTTTIVSKSKRAILKDKIGLILVDYIQLIECPGRSENRNVEIGKICRTLKTLARNTGVPIVAAAQLSRANKKESRKPQLIDLREGGNMEGEADKAILLYNPHIDAFQDLDPALQAERVQAQLIVAKHRGGPKGNVSVWFTPSQTRFDECTLAFEDPAERKRGRRGDDSETPMWWN